MLPQKARIPRKLFGEILDSRRYLNSDLFTLKIAPSEHVRVAVSVSKKVSKRAVVRNKIRRRVYVSVRDILSDIKPGLYLIVVRPGAEKVKKEELKSDLVKLIRSTPTFQSGSRQNRRL